MPAEGLDDKDQGLATPLCDDSQLAIRTTKMAVNISLKQLAASIMDKRLAFEALSNASRDHQQAVTAFGEKRKPVFGG